MLSLREAQLKVLEMYVQVVTHGYAESENFNPSMNDEELLYMAEQFTRDGITEHIISKEEALELCDAFVMSLRTLVTKTLETSPAVFGDQTLIPTTTLPENLQDVDIHMDADHARTTDNLMDDTPSPGVTPPFIYPMRSGSTLDQQSIPPPALPQHPTTFSSPTLQIGKTRLANGLGRSEEDEVEMELWDLETCKRGKSQTPEHNHFNVGARQSNLLA